MNITTWLLNSGINRETLFLLLFLPYLTFVVGFFRHLLGIKTFGLYEPVAIAFALFFLNSNFGLGLKYGIPILIIAWLVEEIIRRILAKARLHYIAKVSIKVSVASILTIVFLATMASLGYSFYKTVSIFPVIILITMIETLSLFKVKKGDLYTNIVSLETLAISIFSYFLMTLGPVMNFVINYPYLVFLPVIANFAVGRWSGLRLSEVIRFKDIWNND